MNRRGFLKYLGLAPAVAALPALPVVAAPVWAYATEEISRDVLLEAIERAVNPPIVSSMIPPSELSLFPGGISWVDMTNEAVANFELRQTLLRELSR